MIERTDSAKAAQEYQQMLQALFKITLKIEEVLNQQADKKRKEKAKIKPKTKQSQNKNQPELKKSNPQTDRKDNESLDSNSEPIEKPEYLFSIKENDQLVYGQLSSGEVINNSADFDLLGRIQNATQTPLGQKTISNLEIKVGDEIVLQTNDEGIVEVNNYQQELAPPVQAIEVSQKATNELNNNPSLNVTQQNSPAPVPNYLKAILSEIQQQNQSQIEQLSGSIAALHNQNRILTQELLRQRTANNRNPKWWKLLAANVVNTQENIVAKLTAYRRESRAAMTVKKLFQKQTKLGTNSYFAGNYTIRRQASFYSLEDKNNRPVLKFRATAAGVKILENNLSESQYQDLNILKEQLNLNETNLGKFARYGEQEFKREGQVLAILSRIEAQAKKANRIINVSGKNYQWTANPNGDIQILATGKTEPILIKNSNQLVNRMSERDLAFFDQKLQHLEANSHLIASPSQPLSPVATPPRPSSISTTKNRNKDDELGM